MSSKPVFDVAVVGLDASHLRLIEIVFRHIQHNRYGFRLADPAGGSRADILIACVADPLGRVELARARACEPPRSAIAVVGPDDPTDGRPAILVPELVRQLLPILNRVVELDGLAGGPRRRAPAPAPGAPVAASPVSPAIEIAPRRRVLIVDARGAAIAEALERMGFASDVAAGCAEARARLQRTRYDLVLLELSLPDGEGFALARSVRRDPRGAPPVLVVSRRRSVLDVIRAAAIGCSGFLAKPAREADLRLAVSRSLFGGQVPDTAPLASPAVAPVLAPR